jgi:hypothetical protein
MSFVVWNYIHVSISRKKEEEIIAVSDSAFCPEASMAVTVRIAIFS